MKKGAFYISAITIMEWIAFSGCGGIARFQTQTPSTELPAVKETVVETSLPDRVSLTTAPSKEYRIGLDDELDISVFGDSDLAKIQTVRPDGKIAFPLLGDVQAASLTSDELREQIAQRLSQYVRNPRVTVIIKKYNSRKVSLLGEVTRPGLLLLSADISLLEGISQAGGVTKDADLEGALLVRDGQILPVSFEKLLRQGDLSQNLTLRPNDAIFIPNVGAKKIFILGEVSKPLALTLNQRMSVLESISIAGGFTKDAESSNVLIVRGGLGAPKLMQVNVNAIINEGKLDQNVLLQSGDIVYVPASFIANALRFFDDLKTVVGPIVLGAAGITLYPDVKSVLQTGKTTGQQGTQRGLTVGP